MADTGTDMLFKNTDNIDFVVPNGNEKEFIDFTRCASTSAKGCASKLVFLYTLEEYEKARKNNQISECSRGVLINGNAPKLQQALKMAKSISKYIVVDSPENLRYVMESAKGLFISGVEFSEREDFVHFRNSGVNHILLNIARERNITFVFDFRRFLELDKRKKAVALGRLKQNIDLFRKYKVKFMFASFADSTYSLRKDFMSFLRILDSNKTGFDAT